MQSKERIVYKEFWDRGRSSLNEEYRYYIYQTDTNAILVRGILGFDAAKEKSNSDS